MTLVELLVVVAIAAMFAAGGLMLMLTQMKQINRDTADRMDALQSARYALDTISRSFSTAWYRGADGTEPYFKGECDPNYKTYGNGYDDDDDGLIDEELFNAKADTEQPWQATYDLHADLGDSQFERPYFHGSADPGDLHLDVDTKFASSTISFRVEPRPDDPHEVGRRVESYYIGSYQGKDNVLIQKIERYGLLGEQIDTVISPLAYNCLSFGTRFWSNTDDETTSTPKWSIKWDTDEQPVDKDHNIYRHIPLYADFDITIAETDAQVVAGKPVPSVNLRTGNVCEGALADYLATHP